MPEKAVNGESRTFLDRKFMEKDLGCDINNKEITKTKKELVSIKIQKIKRNFAKTNVPTKISICIQNSKTGNGQKNFNRDEKIFFDRNRAGKLKNECKW